MAFLVLFFTVVLALCVLGLCIIAIVAIWQSVGIWQSVRDDRKLEKLERETHSETTVAPNPPGPRASPPAPSDFSPSPSRPDPNDRATQAALKRYPRSRAGKPRGIR